MASNSNDDPFRAPDEAPRSLSPAPAPADAPPAADAAHGRFNTCRWQQPAEEGNAAFCTHREVKPYAGTTGFDPGAWCLECQYFKLRRTPKKRQPSDEYSY